MKLIISKYPHPFKETHTGDSERGASDAPVIYESGQRTTDISKQKEKFDDYVKETEGTGEQFDDAQIPLRTDQPLNKSDSPATDGTYPTPDNYDKKVLSNAVLQFQPTAEELFQTTKALPDGVVKEQLLAMLFNESVWLEQVCAALTVKEEGISPDFILKHLEKNGSHDTFGVGKFTWRLEEVPVNKIYKEKWNPSLPMGDVHTTDNELNPDHDENNKETWSGDEREARHIVKLKKLPPIVVVEKQHGKYEVYDGRHRSRAAFLRGDKTIKAYVGVKKLGESRATAATSKFSWQWDKEQYTGKLLMDRQGEEVATLTFWRSPSYPSTLNLSYVGVPKVLRGSGIATEALKYLKKTAKKEGFKSIEAEITWVGAYQMMKKTFGNPAYITDPIREYTADELQEKLPKTSPENEAGMIEDAHYLSVGWNL